MYPTRAEAETGDLGNSQQKKRKMFFKEDNENLKPGKGSGVKIIE